MRVALTSACSQALSQHNSQSLGIRHPPLTSVRVPGRRPDPESMSKDPPTVASHTSGLASVRSSAAEDGKSSAAGATRMPLAIARLRHNARSHPLLLSPV